METSKIKSILYCQESMCRSYDQGLIIEEPLSIRVDGEPYSVVMRTPGEEISHAAGFCLAEGLIDHPEDIGTIGLCDEDDTNVVTVTLQPGRRDKVKDLLERRGFVSQTSCGICGKELITDMQQILTPVKDEATITVKQAIECVDKLIGRQELYKTTRGAHSAMIFNYNLESLSQAEDVGRHNALDKAIGKVFMDGKLESACLAALSSRISYELVQKANRADLVFLVGMSRPTSLAVELGQAMNMTIASIREGGLLIFCGSERFVDLKDDSKKELKNER
ncbi:MAG: formate dehydrogenase accessory sulfurtransferase FdhD [Deltaproteobacteria bacterium]|nr:formate dehydrogenase accessory sulfurtransferase FdhD [Deltaproteobacteria bacterium]MBW1848274.1 formate dehydrogenase accessory sulfurtransferase FdhD [Deltaproteobacteria bacterium]MBW2179288.1 formate dehydrogenase accessory sulfurtransferase FdhD [Deltaproteobacteria bacterium]